MDLNATLDKFDLIDINRAFHLKKNPVDYMFFSSTHGTLFTSIDKARKQASMTSRRLKLYQAYFLTAVA